MTNFQKRVSKIYFSFLVIAGHVARRFLFQNPIFGSYEAKRVFPAHSMLIPCPLLSEKPHNDAKEVKAPST